MKTLFNWIKTNVWDYPTRWYSLVFVLCVAFVWIFVGLTWITFEQFMTIALVSILTGAIAAVAITLLVVCLMEFVDSWNNKRDIY